MLPQIEEQVGSISSPILVNSWGPPSQWWRSDSQTTRLNVIPKSMWHQTPLNLHADHCGIIGIKSRAHLSRSNRYKTGALHASMSSLASPGSQKSTTRHYNNAFNSLPFFQYYKTGTTSVGMNSALSKNVTHQSKVHNPLLSGLVIITLFL